MVPRPTSLAVVAVLAGAAVGAAVVWTSLPGQAPLDCGFAPGANTPLGSFLAFGPPTEESRGTVHWYNSSIVSAGGGLSLHNLVIQVESQNRTPIVPGPAWSLNVFSSGLTRVGGYTLSSQGSGNWTSTDSYGLNNQLVFVLIVTPQDLSRGGDSWNVFLVGTYSNGCPATGMVSASIP